MYYTTTYNVYLLSLSPPALYSGMSGSSFMHEVGGTLLDSKGSSTSAERPAFSDEDDVPPPSPTTTGYTFQHNCHTYGYSCRIILLSWRMWFGDSDNYIQYILTTTDNTIPELSRKM